MTLPIVWLPSPYKNLRDPRYPIRGVVNHRIVGSLQSARGAFGVAPGTSRNASSHFGIGLINGRLTVDQYVDLSDMAWTNGDVREPTWKYYQAGVNPNLTTVTIEHEDGGTANRGRVSDAVWETSIALQKLITSGEVRAIRAQGIRVRFEETVRQLALVSKDIHGFIDHHQIAGPNKPYCFRRWLDDPGFVEGTPSRRDRLLAALKAPETEMDFDSVVGIVNRAFLIGAGATARRTPAFDPRNPDGNRIIVHDADHWKKAILRVKGTPLIGPAGEVWNDSPLWVGMERDDGDGMVFYHEQDVKDERPLESTDGSLQSALDLANKRTASVKTDAAKFIRNLGAANTDIATGAAKAALSVEGM